MSFFRELGETMDDVEYSIDYFFDGAAIREGRPIYNPPSGAITILTLGLGLAVPALVKMGLKRLKNRR